LFEVRRQLVAIEVDTLDLFSQILPAPFSNKFYSEERKKNFMDKF